MIQHGAGVELAVFIRRQWLYDLRWRATKKILYPMNLKPASQKIQAIERRIVSFDHVVSARSGIGIKSP